MSTVKMKRFDTRPVWRSTLKRPDGEPFDLTGATVTFIARYDGGEVRIQAPMTGWGGAALSDNGQVEYQWQPADTDTAGYYRIEQEIVFPDGGKQTVPTQGFDRLIIFGDLDNQ